MQKTKSKQQEKARIEQKMVCPECNANGLKSLLFHRGSILTTPEMRFWDEEGEYHMHAPESSHYYRCSRGHNLEYHSDLDKTEYCPTCLRAQSDDHPSLLFLQSFGFDDDDMDAGFLLPRKRDVRYWLEFVPEDEMPSDALLGSMDDPIPKETGID